MGRNKKSDPRGGQHKKGSYKKSQGQKLLRRSDKSPKWLQAHELRAKKAHGRERMPAS